MNLDLTADQRAIRDEAGRFLDENSSSKDVRRIVDAGGGTDEALWRTVARDLGWCAMSIPEECGGLGLDMTEMSLLMEVCGAHLACMPLWSTACLAAPLLVETGNERARETLLPAIAGGEISATVAWPALAHAEQLIAISVTARPEGEGYRLEGEVAMVADLPGADLILVPARLPDGTVALFALDRTLPLKITVLKTLDATRPLGALSLTDLAVPAEARVDENGIGASAAERALAFGILGLAAEQLGAARAVMDLTLAYIGERVQFGRTIASFQAIKHRCAKLEVDFAEARSLVYGAAAGFSDWSGEEANAEVAAARVLASELLFRAAEESIQLHGGVGFTWEYDPHLYFKRAQASNALLGAPEGHLDAIADAIIGRGAEA